MSDIKETIKKFIDLEKVEYHRFNSWRKCYQYFQDIYFMSEGDDDTAALHLGFYLASWGMYRGSSFLLQNDYTIHIEVVKIIRQCSSKDIYDFGVISDIKGQIINHYKQNAHKNSKDNNLATDTLITKILLGALGNTPAYDRYFIDGVSLYNQNNSNDTINKKFSKESLEKLNAFYEKNKDEFMCLECKFPKMKLIDMYFWQLGFDDGSSEKLNKRNSRQDNEVIK